MSGKLGLQTSFAGAYAFYLSPMEYSLLLVDDDEDDTMLLATHLKQCHQNITLTYAGHGLEATQQLLDGLHPHLILVDAQMPLMNGYELVSWLMESASWRHIPVVVWTGAMSASEVTRHYRAGANAVLLKEEVFKDLPAFCHHWFQLVQLPESVWQEPT